MHLPPDDWNRPIIPTEAVGYTPVNVDAESAVKQAFDRRPEIQQTHLSTDSQRVRALYARNQVLPKVDFALGYGAAGLAGRSAIIDPVTEQITGYTATGYSHALSQVLGRDFPSWSVGFNLGVPILNIGARAEAKRASLDYEQSRTQEEQTRQNIAVQVRATVRAIDTTAKEITATKAARDAAAQNLDAERKRYENGMTTNFNVLQIQQQLSDARAREIQALVAYNKAVAAYHRAVGDLLETRNISVDQPPTADEPGLFSSFDRYNWLRYGNETKPEEKK
jgi:outer membrane protein TolC